jgi:hypothetical protein
MNILPCLTSVTDRLKKLHSSVHWHTMVDNTLAWMTQHNERGRVYDANPVAKGSSWHMIDRKVAWLMSPSLNLLFSRACAGLLCVYPFYLFMLPMSILWRKIKTSPKCFA